MLGLDACFSVTFGKWGSLVWSEGAGESDQDNWVRWCIEYHQVPCTMYHLPCTMYHVPCTMVCQVFCSAAYLTQYIVVHLVHCMYTEVHLVQFGLMRDCGERRAKGPTTSPQLRPFQTLQCFHCSCASSYNCNVHWLRPCLKLFNVSQYCKNIHFALSLSKATDSSAMQWESLTDPIRLFLTIKCCSKV